MCKIFKKYLIYAVIFITLFAGSCYSNETNTSLPNPETAQLHHKKYIKILSIDGGGIRGIIPAIMLNEIESRTGQPISKTFDIIAGTSTGGIITLYLASPSTEAEKHSAENLVKLYENDGKQIFKRSKSIFRNIPLLTSKYDSRNIEIILKDKFGINSTFENINQINPNLKVIITSYDIINNKPCYFTNYADKSSSKEQIQFTDINGNMKLYEIARATSAAPTVFNYYSYRKDNNKLAAFIDGGMFANNPALVAYFEAKKLQKLGILDPDAELLIVSLGTGSYPIKMKLFNKRESGLLDYLRPSNGGMPALIDFMYDGINKAIDMTLSSTMGSKNYYRFQPYLDFNTRIDDVRDKHIKKLKESAKQQIDNPRFNELITTLEQE